MSWDGYIDSVTGGCQASCDKVCIIGLVGGALWTTDGHANHLPIQPAEAKCIAERMNSMDASMFQANGIMINGEKYQFLREDKDEGIVLGKKKEQGSITIHKTDTAVVIAHTIEGMQHSNVNKGVEKIVSYLKSVNM